jgi:hypothetical protein
MRRLAILLALILLPGCVHHSGPYGYRSGPVIYSRGYSPAVWRHPPPRWHAPPPRHWHGHHGWNRPSHWGGSPRWQGQQGWHRPYRPHHWR